MLRKEKDRDTNGFYKFMRERERTRGTNDQIQGEIRRIKRLKVLNTGDREKCGRKKIYGKKGAEKYKIQEYKY